MLSTPFRSQRSKAIVLALVSTQEYKTSKVSAKTTKTLPSSSFHSMRKSSSAICQFYKSSRGCKFGTNCKFVHSFSPDIPDSTSNDGSLSSRFINSSITANQQNSSRSLQIRNKDDSVRKATAPNKTSNTSKLCYNFIKNGNCRFGSECRFSHQREELDDTDGVGYSASTGARSERPKTRNTFLKDKPDVRSRKRPKPICQYYQAGSCRKGNECKFRHVGKAEEFIGELTFAQQDSNFENLVVEKAQELTIDDKPAENAEKEASDKSNKVRVESTSIKHQEALRDEEQTKLKRQNRIQRRPFIPVGNFIQELKRETATDEEILHERSVEIEQLKKRFTTEKLTVLPKVDDKDVFHLIFSSSDPDWVSAIHVCTCKCIWIQKCTYTLNLHVHVHVVQINYIWNT